VALQAVSDCNTLLTPLLPHASQKVFEALGGVGVWAAQPDLIEVTEEGGSPYPVLTGDYTAQQARWESIPIAVGTPLAKPTPIFAKLDDTLAQTGPAWAPIA
jgi:methionyl-tRNA synthetase